MKDKTQITDQLLGVQYELKSVNAQVLQKTLLGSYTKRGIEVSSYNDTQSEMNLGDEVYEYQNFFVLVDGDDLILLDGFRRLLWATPPNININVRFYERKDLTDEQLMSLMVNLNHFKFFGGSAYFERGFKLFLHTVINLDIRGKEKLFDACLRGRQDKISYYRESNLSGDKGFESVSKRLISPRFLPTIRFIFKVADEGLFVNEVFVTNLVGKVAKRGEAYDVDEFLKLCKSDEILLDLSEKCAKNHDFTSGHHMQKHKDLLAMYDKKFSLMDGEVPEKAYPEKLLECKEVLKQFKKDTNLMKINNISSTQYGNIYTTILKLYVAHQKGIEVKFKSIIFPHKEYNTIYGENEDFKFLGLEKFGNLMSSQVPVIGLDEEHTATHSFRDWSSYMSYKNIRVPSPKGVSYSLSVKVEIFVVLHDKLTEFLTQD